ncbi:hypothetical protein PHYBOEH_007409 [Phytophthora boehmeriae]|uniref:Uncharacterized protein n=1 Tax=Phytophthora boehmeriae TaxID=109152 RepID=A0A8T1W6I6_9STRA|nr:hypothetical protein PHYBOEH_007409 [Phytophthora boehmeriae]
MYKTAPADRIHVMAVVDELKKFAGQAGALSRETDHLASDIGKTQLLPSSVTDTLSRIAAEMKTLVANYDIESDWKRNALVMIYELLWDRLEQVATQVFPDGNV